MAYKKLPAQKAREIALDGFKVYTLYRNEFPFNCGLCKDGVIWGDCWCMFPKVLIWSWAVGINPFLRRKEGTYFYNGVNGSYDGIGASGLGDWDGDTIMSVCTNVRSDFSKKEVAELMLISGQHMAMHIGEFDLNDGKLYNSVEFNKYNDEYDGLIPFWTDEFGVRYFWKGGPATGGKFDLIGKLSKWIDYSQPKPSPKQITVDGIWGKETTKLAQTVYGCKTVSGIIKHQKKSYKKVCPACDMSSWKFDGTEGYSPLIAKIQKELKLGFGKDHPSYGKFTKKTRRYLQKKIGVVVTGTFDAQSVRAFQRYINKKAKAK